MKKKKNSDRKNVILSKGSVAIKKNGKVKFIEYEGQLDFKKLCKLYGVTESSFNDPRPT